MNQRARAKRFDETIRGLIDDRQEVYLSFLTTLLRFPTISGEEHAGPHEMSRKAFERIWRVLENECKRLDLEMRVYGDEAAIIEWKGADPEAPAIGVAAHLDVVPVDEDWSHPPFGGTIDQDAVWGRGAQDDKGPVATVLSAFDAMRRLGVRPQRTIQLWLGTREETTDWPDMDRLLEHEEPPAETIVPDGAFPLQVGEKGIVTAQWDVRWEPPDDNGGLRFEGLVAGERSNVVPASAKIDLSVPDHHEGDVEAHLEEAGVRLCRLRAEMDPTILRAEQPDAEGRIHYSVMFHGRAAHAAMPYDGHNAALDALAFVTLVPEIPPSIRRFASFVYDHTRSLDASAVGLDLEHEEMGHTTLSLGRVVIEPHGAQSLCNVRFPAGLHVRDIKYGFQRAVRQAEDLDLDVQTSLVGRPQEAFHLEEEDCPELLEALGVAYETVTGCEAQRITIAGTTYAKLFPLAVGFGPVDINRDEPVLVHQADERVGVPRHLENIRMYALALILMTTDDSPASLPPVQESDAGGSP